MLKRFTFLILLALPFILTAQEHEKAVSDYFEQIRNSEASLRYFFQKMPKGADLHHHYSGSIYAETYLKAMEEADLWVNTRTLELKQKEEKWENAQHWSKVSTLKDKGLWSDLKIELSKKWSTKYFTNQSHSSDEHFFRSFDYFDLPARLSLKEGLLELKKRAKNEKLSYLETMFTLIPFSNEYAFETDYERQLFTLQEQKNTIVQSIFESLYKEYVNQSHYLEAAKSHNQTIEALHTQLKLDDENFKIRYQNFIIRVTPPIHVFKNLLACFASADLSDLIVGINIVAPEHNEIAMRDYWLHMQMFDFFSRKFPNVKIAMHAGELTLGLVEPEELSWHIDEAVHIAKAQRIGHGVDIAYEYHAKKTLQTMRENQIAIEINLSSNDFILGVSGSNHPIRIYHQHEVPIVICTDDAGVLRTDLTQQYVILGKNFKDFSYETIKKFVYNGITYSFLNEKEKAELILQLNRDFNDFEKNILN